MAARYTKSIKCQICDGIKNINSRCTQCKMTICEHCKITHESTGHSIISFNDIDCCVLDIQLKHRVKKMSCKKHPYLTYSNFCQTCDCLVCESCVLQDHVLHDLSGIDNFLDKKLRANGKEVSDKLPKHFLARSPSREDDYCIEQAQSNENENCIAQALSQECQMTTATFRTEHLMVTSIPTVYFLKTVSADTAWIGCKEKQIIQKVRLPITSKVDMFKFLLKAIKIDIECEQIDQVEGFQPIDIGVIEGDILFLSYLDHYLKRAIKDNYGQIQICNIHNFHPLDPTCIHVDRKNKLIWIGLKERGKDDIHPMSIRKIIAISETWKEEKTFEFSTAGKRLFTFPLRIKDVDGQICVLDRTSRTTARVISLNSLGHWMWEYNNPQGFNPYGIPFCPTAMATTKSNNIVVLDAANRSLHILNKSGKLIVFKSIQELGIENPFSIDVDETGQLWIGSACHRGSGETKAKIYILHMSINI